MGERKEKLMSEYTLIYSDGILTFFEVGEVKSDGFEAWRRWNVARRIQTVATSQPLLADTSSIGIGTSRKCRMNRDIRHHLQLQGCLAVETFGLSIKIVHNA